MKKVILKKKVTKKKGPNKTFKKTVRKKSRTKPKKVLDASAHEKALKRIEKLNRCFLSFTTNHHYNIQKLTEFCGEVLGATCSLYNKLDGELLCSLGQWKTPPDFQAKDSPYGHICYDVIKGKSVKPIIINDLDKTDYYNTDPNVSKYALKTYVGRVVKRSGKNIGSLCCVYQKNIIPDSEELKFMEIVASAIGIEEEQHEVSEKLRAREEEYQSIIEHMNNIYYRHSVDHKLTYLSPQAQEIFETDPKNILTDWTKLLTDNPINQKGIEYTEKAIKTGKKGPVYQLEIMTKKGNIKLLEINESPVVKDGKTVAMVGSATDVTDIVKKDSELQKLSLVAQKSHSAIIITDNTGRIEWVNEGFSKITGYASDEVVGKRPATILNGKNTDKQTVNYMRDKLTDNEGVIVELLNYDKWGSEVWFLIEVQPVFDNEGEVVNYIAIETDITETKKAQKDKHDMQKQVFLASKLASIGELAAGVGHEINNPLAIINGYIGFIEKFLLKNKITDSGVRSAIKSQKNAVQRISNIVNGLRTFAHFGEQKKEEIDIVQAVEEVLGFLKVIYEKENIKIEKDLYDGELFVICEQGQFQQVVTNLLTNARDATKGRKDRKIRISVQPKYEHVMVSFKDNGIGIAEDEKDNIFDPFYTTKEVGEGTGLGLGIVRSILNEMKATIEVDGQLGIGTEFIIKIPLLQKKSANEEESTITKGRKRLSGKALVVDDERELRHILRFILMNLGLEVDEADNGEDGLKKSLKNGYDYIITDLKMPKMSGEEMIKKIRQNSSINSKILIISGAIDSDFSKLDADGLINKPFNEDKIFKSLTAK